MNTRTTLAAALVVALGGALPAAATESATVKVFVENYAPVPDGMMAQARAVASGIFGDAGVRLEWIEAPRLLQADPGDGVSLVIVPADDGCPGRYRARTFGALGQAAFDARRARVFFSCIEKLSWLKPVSRTSLLGRVMAHEIGHLVLGRAHRDEPHAAMRPRLDLRPGRAFRFSPSEAAAMRDRLSRRRIRPSQEALTPSVVTSGR